MRRVFSWKWGLDFKFLFKLKTILRKLDGNTEMHSCGSGVGPVSGSCEHGNEPSGSIKWMFLRVTDLVVATRRSTIYILYN
jgi:hypothetical protein